MELVELALQGLEVQKADPDDEQMVRWRRPLMVEALTAEGFSFRFRNRAERRPKIKRDQKRYE